LRNLYDSGVFPRPKGGEDTEKLIGVFRNHKTAKGVREGGALTISRSVIRGGMFLPPQILRVVVTETFDFDDEVPRVLAELGLSVADGTQNVVKRYRKTSIEFPIHRLLPGVGLGYELLADGEKDAESST
jgi:hypothetical protein